MPKTFTAVSAARTAPSAPTPIHPVTSYVDAPSPQATILGRGRELSHDTRSTGLNNNVLVIGPSGAGKTRHVLKPNLLQMSSSYVVLDAKGTLCREVGPVLAKHGYDVQRIDFSSLCGSADSPVRGVHDMGYNPLAFIRHHTMTELIELDDEQTGECFYEEQAKVVPNQQDILSIATALCPIENHVDPFWDRAAANLLAVLVAYAVEALPEEEQNLSSVITLVNGLGNGSTFALFDEMCFSHPDSMAHALFRRYQATITAGRMHASILGIIAEKVMALGFDGALRLYQSKHQVDFARLGHECVALFVTMSDVDRALDPLVSLFCTQAFSALLREADRCPEGRLPQPVRFLLDDFANLTLPNIDDVLAVARSRDLWVTMLMQSYNQLEARYGRPLAMSIMGNCDTHQVLAFQDVGTAQCYTDRANKTLNTLLETPAGHWWLFIRGQRAELVDAFRLEEHPCYGETPEANPVVQITAAEEVGDLWEDALEVEGFAA